MANRVLVPVDWSEQADAAVDLVFDEFPEATLVLLHVINPAEAGFSTQASIPSASEDWYEQEKERAESLFDGIEERADNRGMDVERELDVGRPTTTIVEFTEDNDIDHIVMGSHGRQGVTRILLGSVTETVVRRSSVPVTVVR